MFLPPLCLPWEARIGKSSLRAKSADFAWIWHDTINLRSLTQQYVDMFNTSYWNWYPVEVQAPKSASEIRSWGVSAWHERKSWSMHCFLFPPQAPQLSPLVTWHHPWLPGVKKSPRQKADVLWGCYLVWNQTQPKQVWLEGSDKRNKQHFTKRVMSRTPELFPKYLNLHCWNIFRNLQDNWCFE